MLIFPNRVKLVVLICAALLIADSPLIGRVGAQEAGTPPAGGAEAEYPCADGRLRVRDLENADSTMSDGIERTRQQAIDWEEDARLYSLQLVCPLLEAGYAWIATYFSESAQAFWRSGTAEIEAAEDNPDTIKTLVTDGLSFQLLYGSLLRAGYGDDLVLNVTSGVTVRYNTATDPFGPQTAPKDAIYYHVAIEQRGEVADIWVSATDGTIYRYAT